MCNMMSNIALSQTLHGNQASMPQYILIYFLAFTSCVTLPPASAVGSMGLIFGSTYISVSKSTPLAVTGPHEQLASIYLAYFGSEESVYLNIAAHSQKKYLTRLSIIISASCVKTAESSLR